MAITYTAALKDEWESFKNNGGKIVFEVDPEDIASDRGFETDASLRPNLATGFELAPTSLIDTPELQALIQTAGSEWSYIFMRIYLAGGKVIYRRLPSGKYSASCEVSEAKPNS